MDDETIRILVSRLSRQHSSGGEVIERAAILAEGADSAEILEWIVAHKGQPEAQVPTAAKGGLHSARLSERAGTDSPTPRRYVLPPGVLSP